MQLTDAYGRTIKSLRISLTNRCNLKCIYCHREGETRDIKIEMNARTIANIVKASKTFGISKVKFSGGEPLMRDDFEDIIAALPELKDISATTNGIYLASRAESLADSGLSRINISLPSLSPEKYRKVTGGDISRVLAGINAAVECLAPVKLNMVLLNGINDNEIIKMMDFIRKYEGKVILQLIELMDFQKAAKYKVNINEVEQFLESKASDIKERALHRRKKYFIDGVEVELVRPIDNSHFCANCSRLRVTSDGRLKPCLFRNDNLVDVNNKEPQEIVELLKLVMDKREPFYKG
ncbi:MAG: GTP 3',8-cyclase MoaA [Euryarchaeota archaeon]|nr:GTP 3',8-cyclase MoaA [Euryarchaeota archaeon]MBU4492606.1 GTP 3',8-cyclase MoaA [Euryarchaeota archaeon]MCG2727351.1 GTP 3',8-cyclase MoaA [Candidatus Methanoperedenaceae archaeon]